MRNNLKKLKLLFVLLFAVFYSCEKDLYNEAFKPEINQKANVRTSTLKEVFKEENFILAYKKIPKKKAGSSSDFSRSTFEENNGFTIINAPVKIVDRDGVVTYTLLIERDNNVDGKLENLVLYSQPQNNEIGYVIKYNSFREDELTEEEVNDNGISEIEGILTEDNAEGRVLYISYWVSHCIVGVNDGGYCGGNSSNPYFTHNCGHWEDGFIYIGDDLNFEGGGGSGGGGTGDTGGGYLGSGGGTGTGSGIPTSPVVLSPKDLLIKEFKKHLFDTGNTTCFNSLTLENQEKILNFLNPTLEEDCDGNLYTNEQQFDFIEEIIAAKCSNSSNANIDETNYPGMNEGMPYNWWKDDEFIRNNLLVAFEVPNIFEILAFNMFPAYALLHIENSTTALDEAISLTINNPTVFTPTGIEDGKADAFRHAYWNALDSAEFGPNITKIFTTAHEAFSCGLPKTMDLYNNQKGRQNTADNGFGFTTSNSMIKSSILNDVYLGNLVYINNILLTTTNY